MSTTTTSTAPATLVNGTASPPPAAAAFKQLQSTHPSLAALVPAAVPDLLDTHLLTPVTPSATGVSSAATNLYVSLFGFLTTLVATVLAAAASLLDYVASLIPDAPDAPAPKTTAAAVEQPPAQKGVAPQLRRAGDASRRIVSRAYALAAARSAVATAPATRDWTLSRNDPDVYRKVVVMAVIVVDAVLREALDHVREYSGWGAGVIAPVVSVLDTVIPKKQEATQPAAPIEAPKPVAEKIVEKITPEASFTESVGVIPSSGEVSPKE